MTKKKLKQLDNMIKEILNVSHDAIVVSNSNMEIIHVNKVAIDLFGYSENEILGIKILNLLPKRKKENYIKDEQKISEERITVSNVDSGEDFFAKKKDGTEFSIELTWVNWEGKSKNHYNIAQIRDITKRKTYQSDLEISNRALTVISECNKVIISAIDEISYFQDICNIIVANGGYISVWIALVKHDENKSIEPVAYQGYEKGFLESSGLTWELHGQKTTGPSARAVNTKKIAICNNIQSDPRYDFWSKEAKKRGYNSSISLPLIIDGNVEAVLAILSEDPYAYNNDEIKLLEQLSSDISFGIKSLRLKKAQVVIENHLKENEKKLLLSNRYLQVISQSNKSLAEANSVEEYLEDICKIIVNIGGHLKSLIQRINYRGSVTIDTLAIYGNSLGEYEEKQLLAQGVKSVGLTAICVEEKRPVVYQNIIDSGNFIYWDKDPKKIKFQSAVVIPMIKNDQVVGTLRVFSRDPFSYNNKEVELLQDLANDIAYSIDLIKSKEKRVLVENKLNESENKYKNLFEDSNDAIFLADAETGIIIDANKKAEELLDIKLNDIIGMHQTDLHPSEDKSKYKNTFENHVKSKQIIDEFYIINKSGKHIPVHVSSSTTMIDEKKILQGVFRDISATKLAEENLRSTQKMEALGTLSGGIAHDFNNILTPIIGYTELAKMELDSKNGASKYLNEVIKASNRAKELVHQILTFCRKGDLEVKPFRIQPIIKEVLKLLTPLMPSTIEIRSDIDSNCGAVMCDPTQIHQVIMNMCTNAYHAMKDNGGILKVVLKCGNVDDFKTDIIEEYEDTKCLCLEISDTGHGMDVPILDRIFEPYFTTKGKYEGTGLGLSVALGIVKSHGGKIYVKSQPREGSLFRIYFPLLEEEEVKKKENKIECIKGGNEHILVVDDEQILTEIISAILKELGYKTTQFNSSREALEDFQKDPQKYDLVFTDQTMPGMVGSDLAKKILKIRPDIPIILCTGYSPLISREDALKIGIIEFLMKPITTSILSTQVRKVLDEKKIKLK